MSEAERLRRGAQRKTLSPSPLERLVRPLLHSIYNHHDIYKTIIPVVEKPGAISERKIHSNPYGVEADGRHSGIDLLSEQVMVTTAESITEAVYRGLCL